MIYENLFYMFKGFLKNMKFSKQYSVSFSQSVLLGWFSNQYITLIYTLIKHKTPTLRKWKYICQGCESVVENDLGFGTLNVKDFVKDFDKKKGKADLKG